MVFVYCNFTTEIRHFHCGGVTPMCICTRSERTRHLLVNGTRNAWADHLCLLSTNLTPLQKIAVSGVVYKTAFIIDHFEVAIFFVKYCSKREKKT